jgi:hypothetical protein
MHWILLHDRVLFGQHLASIAVQLLTSWLWLDWTFYWAVFAALRNIGIIRQKRNETLKTAMRSDRDLIRLLDHFYQTAPIVLL